MSVSHSSGTSAGVRDSDEDDASRRVRAQAEDALELANYVVASGFKGADGQPLAFADIATIHATAGMLGILKVTGGGSQSAAASGSVTKDQWVAFEEAYYRLAMATSPVTAETVRNTRELSSSRLSPGGRGDESSSQGWSLADFVVGYSPAHRFTRLLWVIAIGFALFVIIAEWQINVLGLKEDAVAVKTRKDLWQALQPWAYGGLGACAYLLRSAHYYIYQRSFDIRRKPEYLNRILLGSISGGAIILLTNYLVAEDDTFTHFGSAALGFIAGYSTDFLFNTIERIVTAIFPKVAVETVPRDSSQASAQTRTRQPQKPTDQPGQNQPPKQGGGDPKANS